MPKTVMIVEDNELNMKLFNDLLESRGYSIIQTRNGMEALDLARAHHPDLILMDIQLPEVSGLVVTKWLKEDDDLQSIPVIAVTAFAMKGDEERILQGGCEGYILTFWKRLPATLAPPTNRRSGILQEAGQRVFDSASADR